MASLIPALSDKAKQELKVIAYNKKQSLSVQLSMNDGIEAFQDLFDLDKYPITWEMLLDYINTHHKDSDYLRVKEDYFTIYDHHDDGEPYSQDYTERNTTMDIMLYLIAMTLGIRDIDIIGDIHGWWEKPQTY